MQNNHPQIPANKNVLQWNPRGVLSSQMQNNHPQTPANKNVLQWNPRGVHSNQMQNNHSLWHRFILVNVVCRNIIPSLFI
jgi:hypothetical protein